MPFLPVMLNICCALINPQAPSFVYFHCVIKNTVPAMHTFTDIKLQNNLTPEGRGGDGRLWCEYFKIWTSVEQSPCLMQIKRFGVRGYAWLTGWAESSRAPSHGGFVMFGVCLSVCQRLGGFMGPFSFCAPFTGNTSLARQRNELRTKEREHLFLEDVQDSLWNHEVAGEHWTGRRAGCDHLYLCLPYDCSHWHPTGGWVLMVICFSDCDSLQK